MCVGVFICVYVFAFHVCVCVCAGTPASTRTPAVASTYATPNIGLQGECCSPMLCAVHVMLIVASFGSTLVPVFNQGHIELCITLM